MPASQPPSCSNWKYDGGGCDFGADRLADADQDLVGKGEDAGPAVTHAVEG